MAVARPGSDLSPTQEDTFPSCTGHTVLPSPQDLEGSGLCGSPCVILGSLNTPWSHMGCTDPCAPVATGLADVPRAAHSDLSMTPCWGHRQLPEHGWGQGNPRSLPRHYHPLAWAVLQLTQPRANPGLLQLPAPLNTTQTHGNPWENTPMPVGCTQRCSPQGLCPLVAGLMSNSL